ncbi:uncharacterized protein EDB91DRAFT_1045047 [Suillus paluster]|uniref:uncharacterized protein n=1 Tax=Suillus paluster TaxID=48578 RepID=UPI001B885510|nr:uncharacterized protein EDB91DRAFT_1045047 [Suillus paluster]KAG1752626.1 hypothetical protein EDB91DRAFT_1045047 [Suillus paluster]
MSQVPPEVLIHILKHLHTPRDLYHSLLVSRSWCECSVELLWHRPTFTRLSTLVKMMRVISRGDQTFTYSRFIRRLNFLFLGADLTDALFSRLAQCDHLERLTLVNCNSISEDALLRVLPCLPNLVAIDLTGVVETSDHVVIGLASAARRLQGINLAGCRQVTDAGVYALASNCPLLRRVKLSGVDQVTDGPVSALAKSCPLLLEIDLNNCKRITDISVRDVWTYSTHMREMRLSQCVELTDAAFPAPVKPQVTPRNNPFPTAPHSQDEGLPPLEIPRPLDHLRMLDLTGCALITDDAIDGIISHASKIRNLVLSKCIQLTDRTVENICVLGKHLHYLHLGHAANITDRSIKTLARCCTRLRYVDFANCVLLTDMSVFELSSLPKLRRIGLVRVSNLTDEAIYALAERHSTLERIHLSYCDQISVMAIHFLLQKLHKLTHLSLTGIPSFRKTELQQFCRQAPQEFNMSQRMAFCVYSGSGVAKLRSFLTDLFNTITEDMNADDDETEYDDDFDEGFVEGAMDADMEGGMDGDLDEDFMHDGRYNFHPTPQPAVSTLRMHHPEIITPISQHPELAMQRDMTLRPSHVTVASAPAVFAANNQLPPTSYLNPQPVAGPSNPALRRSRMFGYQPVIEISTSPTHSDVPSNRSAGTAQSNGAGFFRTYQEPISSARSNGAVTPDYNFAELGHGRGTEHDTIEHIGPPVPRHSFTSPTSFNAAAGPSTQGITQVMHSANFEFRLAQNPERHGSMMDQANMANSYYLAPAAASSDRLVPWPPMRPEPMYDIPSHTSQELQDSVQAALSPPTDAREAEGRGRSVKRSLRNTFHAAEHFFFGRGSTSNGQIPESNASNPWAQGNVNNTGDAAGNGGQPR